MAYWNFSVIPLRISSIAGALSACIGFVAAVVTFIRKLIHPAMVIGWSSLMCTLLFFFGLILLALGIIGEYLGKIILTLTGTPQYIVRETINTEKEEKP